MMDLKLVYITAKDVDEARHLGQVLLSEKLAACINILNPLVSMYHWEGKIEEGQETLLIAKTEASLVENLIQKIRSIHSYEVPCVLSIPIEKGNPDYMNWLADTVSG